MRTPFTDPSLFYFLYPHLTVLTSPGVFLPPFRRETAAANESRVAAAIATRDAESARAELKAALAAGAKNTEIVTSRLTVAERAAAAAISAQSDLAAALDQAVRAREHAEAAAAAMACVCAKSENHQVTIRFS